MASVGETLRSAREQRGLTIEQVSHDTRISARFIEALEADRHGELPAPVYVRGFIRSYASYLKLDGGALLAALPASVGGSGGGAAAAAAAGAAATVAGTGARQGPTLDPFRRPTPPQRQTEEFDPGEIITESPAADADEDFYSAQTVRRRMEPPVAAVPPPVMPPDDDIDEDGLVSRRGGGAVLAEGQSGGGISRAAILAGIGVIGVGIAIVTGILMTRGGDDDVTTAAADDGSPERAGGSVVVVSSQTPGPSPASSPTVNQPGAPSGGSQTPTGSPAPDQSDSEDEATATPTTESEEDATETPEPEESPTPESTPTSVPTPEATPTPAPTQTPFPTVTPTVGIQPHPAGFAECTGLGGDCGIPPLRVICPPDGIWFVDANKDYPNPGWPENTSAITSAQAGAIGAAGCQ